MNDGVLGGDRVGLWLSLHSPTIGPVNGEIARVLKIGEKREKASRWGGWPCLLCWENTNYSRLGMSLALHFW